MYGGTITQNSGVCGGIQIYDGTVNLYGGTITGNSTTKTSGSYRAGGVCLEGGVLAVGGDVTITGNTFNGSPSNVCLTEGTVLTFLEPLSANASLGIHTQYAPKTTAPVVLTDGFSGKAKEENFFLDDAGTYEMRVMEGELNLTTPEFTLSLDRGQGTGEMAALKSFADVTLPACDFAPPEGQIFDCWQIGENTYRPGETYTLMADTSAVAIYKAATEWDVLADRFRAGDGITLTKDLTIDADSDALEVPAGKTVLLDLNGHTLSLQTNNGAMGVSSIAVYGKLNVQDTSEGKNGVLVGGIGTTDDSGGGITVYNGGQLWWSGGTLTGGYSSRFGGGVYVHNGGIFSLTGGSIENCTAEIGGGGVYLDRGSQFTMSGNSQITRNTAVGMGSGGGLSAAGTVSFSGASITDNYAKQGSSGGIVFVGTANGTIIDLTVTGNRAGYGVGGVENFSDSIELMGAINITGNTHVKLDETNSVKDEDGNFVFEPSNLRTTKPMRIGGFNSSAHIGIYLYASDVANGPKVLTNDISDGRATLDNFTLDESVTCAELFQNEDGALAARQPTDAPTEAPTDTPAPIDISNAVITAPGNQTYTGKALTPKLKLIKVNGKELAEGTDYELTYAKNIDCGAASITITGKGAYTGKTEASFNITPAAQNIKVTAGKTTMLTAETQKLTVSGNQGALTFSSSNSKVATVDKNGTVKAVAPGKAVIKVKAAKTDNYSASDEKSVTITVKYTCATPKVKAVTAVKGGVKLTLTKPKGAKKLEVFCKKGNGKWQSVGKTTKTTFTAKTSDGKTALKSGVKYTFAVRCVDSTIYTSPMSAGKATYYSAAQAISQVTNPKSKTVLVKWKKVSGVTGYEIQASQSKNFKSYKTVKAAGASKTSASFTKLATGKTWYFRMRTYVTKNGKTYPSAWSATKAFKVKK